MIRLIECADGRRSYLVSERGEREIRQFLRRLRIRPESRNFVETPVVARYHLTGDVHLAVAGRRIPRVTFGELAGEILGWFPLRKAK